MVGRTILSDKAVRAAVENGHGTLALAGGVSANKNLRQMLAQKAEKRGGFEKRIKLISVEESAE